MVNNHSIISRLVNIDIISSSYVKDSIQLSIYSFLPNVSPVHKILENPTNFFYHPTTSYTINNITVWLSDQNGNELNLRGENSSARFHLR